MKSAKKILILMFASISSLDFYKHLNQLPFRWSIATYLCFLLLVAVVNTVWFWQLVAPKLEAELEQSVDQLATTYPETLILQWDGQQLNSNLSPVVIPMPAAAPANLANLSDNLILINTDGSPTDAAALLTITDREIQLQSGEQTGQPVELSTFFPQSFWITPAQIPQFTQKAQLWIKQAMHTVVLLFLPSYYLYLVVVRGIMLLFEVAIIFILFKLNGIRQTFIQLVQLGLHLFIPAEIIHQVSLRIMTDPPISFHSVSFWVLFLIVFFSTQGRTSKTAIHG